MGMWRRKELLRHLFLHLLQHLALGLNLLLDGVIDIEESLLTAVLIGFLQCSHQLQPLLICILLLAFVLFLQVLVLSLLPPTTRCSSVCSLEKGNTSSVVLTSNFTSMEDARPSTGDIWEDIENWEL